MARCASAEKMPVVPTVGRRVSGVIAASRSGSGVTCARGGCDARATERRLSEKLRFAVCEAPQ
eukprot:997003-Prymnesium_polylepis.1